ncbi:MAG: 6-phosphogluconolactonase [Nannocystaceae bacterium]|nr:6-phosphogluconolactonase [Nannocystaceae bacterium]
MPAPTRVLQRPGAIVMVFAHEDDLVEYAARELATLANDVVDARGRFDWTLAGGSTPAVLYRRLAREDLSLPWSRTHVWFGDERCVPPGDPQSNYKMAHDAMLASAPARAAHVHRMHGEDDPAVAAARYEQELRDACGLAPGGFPAFDLTLLGIGEDGHTASLFPGTTAVAVRDRLCVANHVDHLGTWRLTLTTPTLSHSRRVWVFAVGGRKRGILGDVLGGSAKTRVRDAGEIARWPVLGVRPATDVVWWVDEAGAGGLG